METTTYSPDLIPGLSYPSAREGIAYLKRAFGFEEHLVVPGPGDSYKHVELRLGRGIVMCGDAPQDPDKKSGFGGYYEWSGVQTVCLYFNPPNGSGFGTWYIPGVSGSSAGTIFPASNCVRSGARATLRIIPRTICKARSAKATQSTLTMASLRGTCTQ